MRQLILAAGLVLALVVPAAAQPIGGIYDVQGTNLDGSGYGGTAEIVVLTDTTCEIHWSTGGTTSSGICMRNGNAFSAGYVMGDAVGLVIYEVMADGSLEGLWTVTGQDGTGSEILTPR